MQLTKNKPVASKKRKAYTPPSIRLHGKLSRITQAGTGAIMEGTAMRSMTRKA